MKKPLSHEVSNLFFFLDVNKDKKINLRKSVVWLVDGPVHKFLHLTLAVTVAVELDR